MKRLSTDKYPWVLRVEYYKTMKDHPHLRFGQWVWNTYGLRSMRREYQVTEGANGWLSSWPELFYADENTALSLLCKYYEEQHQDEQQ